MNRPRLLVTGASGQLGAYLLRHLRAEGATPAAWGGARGGELFGVPLRPVELTDADAVARAFREDAPAAVVHAAALARVSDCHSDPARARAVNAGGTATLAELCARHHARLVLVSTDLVFDGEHAPYAEGAPPAPVSVYGATKAEAEQATLAHPGNAVVRVSLLFGPSLSGRPTFFDDQAAALRGGRPVTLFQDEWRTPLDLATAARAVVEVARSGVTGLLHVGGPERLSRLEMGQRLAEHLGADPGALVAGRRDQAPAAEPRPRDVALDSSRWRSLFPQAPWPTFAEALRAVAPAP